MTAEHSPQESPVSLPSWFVRPPMNDACVQGGDGCGIGQRESVRGVIADFKSVHATYAAHMQPCDRQDPSVPERPRTSDGPVSEEKWLFGEFGEAPRTLANIDYS